MGMLSRWNRAGASGTVPWRTMDDFLRLAFGGDWSEELLHDCSCSPHLRFDIGEKEVTAMLPFPGAVSADFEVELVGDYLNVRAKRVMADEPDKEAWHFLRRERNWGEFDESAQIPVKVQSGSAKAKYQDGVLYVTMVRSSESLPQKQIVKVK